MQQLISLPGALFILLFSLSAQALDRTRIAESAQDVTPLLNGQSAPNINLQMADGSPISLQAFIFQQPTVVLFYRGGWCPYCSRQLAGLKDIEKELLALGYQVLAISPETPERLQQQKLQSEFALELLSDHKLAAIKGFGVGYYVASDIVNQYTSQMNINLTSEASSGRAVLPAPAVFILDKKGKIKFNYVNPDYKERLSAELLLQAAKLSL